MIKCLQCGNVLKEGQKFCIKCGTKIEDVKKNNQSPEMLASIDILQKKISKDDLNSSLYIELGDIYFENKMYIEAISEFQRAFAIDKNDFNSIFKTAEAYREIKDFSKAEKNYKKALEIDKKSQIAILGLFWSYHDQNKLDELVKLEREISDETKTIDFRKTMIGIYKKLEQPENAFKEMEMIYQLDSKDIENLKDLAEYFDDRDNTKKAFELYTKINSIDPKDIVSLIKMGKYHCYAKDYIKTVELFEKHLPDLTDELASLVKFYISYSYFKLGETNKAIALVQHVACPNIRLSPRDREIVAETCIELSLNGEKQNDLQMAISFMEKAVDYMPKNQKFNDRLKKLKQLSSDKQQKLKKKKLKKTNISFAAIIVAAILIFITVRFINVRNEKIAWEQAQTKNIEQSYETYLLEHPQGKHIKEAIVIKDSLAWLNAKNINELSVYEDYIEKYPEGKYIDIAIVIADSLAWLNAKNNNEFSSYKKYLEKYPNGKNVIIAKEIYQELECPRVVDIDGNVYKTIEIGNLIWMTENLKVTHYRNGDPIPLVFNGDDWAKLTTGAYCYYDKKRSNIALYGNIYNWYVVNDPRGLAPKGWRIPNVNEWKSIQKYLKMTFEQAHSTRHPSYEKMPYIKDAFNLLKGGERDADSFAIPGGFHYMGDVIYYWSRWKARMISINYYDTWRVKSDSIKRQRGIYIRCVKDRN